MYDGLVSVDPDFNVVPRLAKSWDISKDGLTYTFHMRHDARWSDGRPITADDQVFEYQLTRNPATAAPSKVDYDSVLSVSAPEKYTVVYRLNAPNAGFLAGVVGALVHAPLPRHVYGGLAPGVLRASDFTRHLVVSGAYTLREWKPDDHMLLQSNHAWWHRRASIDQIYIKEYKNQSAVLIALQEGSVDTAYFVSMSMWPTVKNDSRYAPVRNPANIFDLYVINMRNPILGDLAVRRAIMYAWDRKTEDERLFHGELKPAVSPIPWALKWAFDPNTERAYAFDPQRAAAILEHDGWKLGADGYRHNAGRLLHFVIGEIAGDEDSVRRFEFLQANLKGVGIKVDATSLEYNVLRDRAELGNFDADDLGYGNSADPDPMPFLSSKAIPPGGYNFGRYSDPTMDELIELGRVATNRAKRAAIYRELQERFVDKLPSLIGSMPYYHNVMSRRIRGFDPTKAGSQFSAMVYDEPNWYVAQ